MSSNTFSDEKGDFPYYLNHEPVHQLSAIEEIIFQQEILLTNSPVGLNALFRALKETEAGRVRQFSSGRKARYGSIFTALLPLGEWSLKKKKEIIQTFMAAVIGEERLIYVAWEEMKGIATYIRIYVTDREWLSYRPLHYKRDVYADSSGKLCNKDNPTAKLIRKKGEIKEWIGTGFSLTKTRIFCYSDREDFTKRFVDFWKQALLRLKTIISGKFVFTRKKLHFEMFRYLKRSYIHQNHLMSYMENILNRLYEEIYPDSFSVYKDGGSPGEPLFTKNNRLLTEIFHHYANRFKNNVFHVESLEFKIIGRADLADANLRYLQQVFDAEISEKFGAICPDG